VAQTSARLHRDYGDDAREPGRYTTRGPSCILRMPCCRSRPCPAPSAALGKSKRPTISYSGMQRSAPMCS